MSCGVGEAIFRFSFVFYRICNRVWTIRIIIIGQGRQKRRDRVVGAGVEEEEKREL